MSTSGEESRTLPHAAKVLSTPPGEYGRKAETQIDGGSHKRWSMWLNSSQREEPYPGLDMVGLVW